MPKPYEDMKDKFIRQGLSDAAAKTKAAKIFNSKVRKPGQPPVTRKGP